jgi:hypothetical protein
MKITSSKLKTLVESMVKEEIKLNENAAELSSGALEQWVDLAVQLGLNPQDPKSREGMEAFMKAIQGAYNLGWEQGRENLSQHGGK